MVARRDRELVRERFTRLDRRLRDEWDSIHRVRKLESVEMDRGRFRQLVAENQLDAVAFANANLRSRHLVVVCPCFDLLTWRCFPLHLRGGDLKDLYSADLFRGEYLVALAFGLRRKRLDAR